MHTAFRACACVPDFSFFDSYMSQPKHQLDTFRHWAGKSSDISYYLNSHHVDFLDWSLQVHRRERRVGSRGRGDGGWRKGERQMRVDVIEESLCGLYLHGLFLHVVTDY